MFLPGLKKIFSSSLVPALTIGTLSVSLVSCEPNNPDCCRDYFSEDYDLQMDLNSSPSSYEHGPAEEAFFQMCHNTLEFEDEKYDVDTQCKYKAVDRYIYEAQKCCEPLRTEIGLVRPVYTPHSGEYSYYGGSSLVAMTLFFPLFVMAEVLDNIVPSEEKNWFESKNLYYLPSNAYTWCLMNTHPRTYKCNLDQARAFERKINECCDNIATRNQCIADYVQQGGQCHNDLLSQCCNGLPDQDTEEYISRSNCEEIFNQTNQCVTTPEDACCSRAPSTPDENTGFSVLTCKLIYKNSNGNACVNTNEEYERRVSACCERSIDKDSCISDYKTYGECTATLSKCCGDLPEQENEDYISKSRCEELFNEASECIRKHVDACCYKAPEYPDSIFPEFSRQKCKEIYMDTDGEKCINTGLAYYEYQKSE